MAKDTLPPSAESEQRTADELEADNASLRDRVKKLEERVGELTVAADSDEEDDEEDDEGPEPWED